MRLFAKFFLCATFVISVALLISGYLLITLSHNGAVNREMERAVNQFQFDNFTVQAGLISSVDNLTEEPLHNTLNRISSGLSGLTLFFAEDRTLIFSDVQVPDGFSLPEDVRDDLRVVEIQTVGDESYITVSGKITQSGVTLYLLIATDISCIMAHNE